MSIISKCTETPASVFMREENVQRTGKQAHKGCPDCYTCMCTSQDPWVPDQTRLQWL